MRYWMIGAAAVVILAGAVACSERKVITRTTLAATHTREDLTARLRQIAQDYRSWPRVSDLTQWSPEELRAPRVHSRMLMSDSDDFTTHGRKLYYLHAQDQKAYMRLAWGDTDGTKVTSSPVGQAVVQESWFAEPVHGAMVPFAGYGVERRANDGAKGADGREYTAGARGDLYVMFKVDPLTQGTDDGWVYGTVTTEGTITSMGRVQSCMNCHTQAPYERLFGAR